MREKDDFKEHGHLLIGATGAINVVNLPGYIVHLRQNVCKNIHVILTEAACTFLKKEAILYVSGNEAFVTGSSNKDFPAPHLSLTSWADIFLILPASANIFAKAAHGIADDLLSSAIVAASCPIVFFPSMNKTMWEKPVTKRNLATLLQDGHSIKYKIQTSLEIATGRAEESIVPDIPHIGQDIAHILSLRS